MSVCVRIKQVQCKYLQAKGLRFLCLSLSSVSGKLIAALGIQV